MEGSGLRLTGGPVLAAAGGRLRVGHGRAAHIVHALGRFPGSPDVLPYSPHPHFVLCGGRGGWLDGSPGRSSWSVGTWRAGGACWTRPVRRTVTPSRRSVSHRATYLSSRSRSRASPVYQADSNASRPPDRPAPPASQLMRRAPSLAADSAHRLALESLYSLSAQPDRPKQGKAPRRSAGLRASDALAANPDACKLLRCAASGYAARSSEPCPVCSETCVIRDPHATSRVGRAQALVPTGRPDGACRPMLVLLLGTNQADDVLLAGLPLPRSDRGATACTADPT